MTEKTNYFRKVAIEAAKKEAEINGLNLTDSELEKLALEGVYLAYVMGDDITNVAVIKSWAAAAVRDAIAAPPYKRAKTIERRRV